MLFFTVDDIGLLHEYREQEYRDTRKGREVQESLGSEVWAKTKYWAELAAGEDFEVEYRNSVLRRAGTKKGKAGGKQTMLRRYRAYSWARLYRPGDETYQVFFTVGVDGEKQELVWKLDCKRDGSNALDGRQVARFDAYQLAEAPHTSWQRVPLAQVKKWSWNKLVAATQKFMADNAAVYDEAIRRTWAGHEPGRDKLARVCWNDYGWQRPSGLAGKSGSGDTHEASEGWGAEEWLFDFERLLDGYHYAYLTSINKALDKHAGKTYNIRLYTRDAVTKTYYYVGRLMNATVLTEAERTEVTAQYQARKWMREMDAEVQAVTGNPDFRLGSDGFGPFNIRFRPEDVERPSSSDGLEVIEEIGEWTDSHYYVLFDDVRAEGKFIKKVKKKKGTDTGEDELDMSGADDDAPKHRPRQRLLRAGAVELPGLHDQVQDRLMEYLRARHPEDRIKREVPIKAHGTRIDVVRERVDQSRIFYEVKVLPTLRACIREALGQLLEYAHWPAKNLAAELVIVSHYASSADMAAYLAKLGESYGLQISYLQIGISDKPTVRGKALTGTVKTA